MIAKDVLHRVKENLAGAQKGPYCIDLVINDFCNLSCVYCSGSAAHDRKDNWTKDALIKVLDSAQRLSVKEISLTSLIGEPTVFKDIEFLMREIKARNFFGSLLTNGARLDPVLGGLMKDINWDVLILSLDSFNPDIQYRLRPSRDKGEYLGKIIDFLGCAVKNMPGCNINLNMVVTRLNYRGIENYFKMAGSFGVKNITLLNLVKMNDNYEGFVLDDKQLAEFKTMLKDIKTPVGFNRLEWLDAESNLRAEGAGDKRKNCYFHLHKILIDNNGQILKCNGDSRKTIFNIRDTELCNIYPNLLDAYKELRENPYCWDTCCSPIKAMNQEIGQCLAHDLRSVQEEAKETNKRINIVEFYIAITNRCNLQCIMCTTGKGRYDAQRELATAQWLKLIGGLNKYCKIKRITFGGGEPLLRSDIVEILKFACASDIAAVNIISNGILLDGKFLSLFSEAELRKIQIIFSLDGLEYDHNFIRGPHVFQEVFRNFEYAYHNYFITGKINSLSLSSILMPENFANYISFLEFISKYQGVKIDIQPVIPNNELCYVKGQFMLTEMEKNRLLEIVGYVLAHPGLSARPVQLIKHYIDYFDNRLIKSGRCLTGYESLNITFEGYPYLCGKEIRIPLCDFSFRDVFVSKEYRAELERIEKCNSPCLQGLHINPDNEYGSGPKP